MSVVIQVNNISKQYRLGQVGTGTLSHDLNSWWHRIRGKEDPYLKVGEENDRSKKGGSEYAWALRDISFSVNDGEVLGIIGRNGAGKSTLLKILSRTTAPSTGNIRVKGRVASLLEVGTGFHPELTGKENIFLNGAILGMNRHEIKRKFDEIVDFAGVERYIDTPVKRYSSGMYVRLAFGVAAHLESEILIVDEVLAVGDAEFQKKCLGKMGEVSRGQGRTVLFVSHNMGAISQLCKKAILLRNGQLFLNDTCDKAIQCYFDQNKSAGNGYQVADETTAATKQMYFRRIFSSNEKGDPAVEFNFYESIILNFEVVINRFVEESKIGFALLDKYGQRVFSNYFFLKQVWNGPGTYNVSVKLPNGLIAPNSYSFLAALLVEGQLFDLIEEFGDIKIVDTGTALAMYEGMDYGNIIVDCEWRAGI